jgi:general secretion pathway protein D
MATIGNSPSAPTDIDVMDKVKSLDILPRSPTQTGSTTTSSGPRAQPAVFQGTEITDTGAPRVQTATAGGGGSGFDLNFESAPVATVAKVVLGDILQTGYTIDPRVQGTVSLVSVRPVPKSDIVFVLENALRISGVVLVRDTAGYRLTPVGDAVGGGHVDSQPSNPEPGYGVSVVPLQYVSAQTLLKLMDSFATKPGVVRADSTRNLLLIQGTGPERRTAVETAMSFDVDWMRGQSIGVFPVANSGPEPIIAELEKIIDSGENGLNQNLVKLQPVARLNAIMVVTKKPALLRTVETWIKRLDRSDSTRTSVHVYKVKYGDAKQIARVLTDMFGGGSSNSSLLDSADNQIAPGSGTSASGSGSFGNNSNGNSNSGTGTNGSNSSSQQPGSGFGSRLGTAFGGPQGGANGGNLGQLDKGNGAGSGGPPLLQNVRITPDLVNNSLLIYADQGNYRIVESALQQVDQPQLQVAIDATIAEVDLTDELQFGVQFFLTSHALGLRPDQGSILNSTSTTANHNTGRGNSGNDRGGGNDCDNDGEHRRWHGCQRLAQPHGTRIQFPRRPGSPAGCDPDRLAHGHRREGVVQPVSGRGQQPGGHASGRQPGSDLDRLGKRSQCGNRQQQYHRQHRRLSKHRHHPARLPSRQRQWRRET